MRLVDRACLRCTARNVLTISTMALCLAQPASGQGVQAAAPPVPAQVAAEAPLVVREPVADLGEVALGARGRGAIFRITNEGAQPVTLSFERLPPGLSGRMLDSPIPAGGSGVVAVDIDTYRLSALDSPFTIATSIPTQPRLQLVVRAKVRAYVQPSPPASRFNFVQFERPGSTVHTVFATDAPDLVVDGVSSSMPFITASFAEVPAAERERDIPGRQWRVTLTIARDAPVGPIGGYVTVTTTHAKQPVTLLPVSGFVRPQFAVTPPALALGEVRRDPAAPALATLVVKSFATDAMEVRTASVDVAGLVVALSTTEQGRSWRVILQATEALQPGAFAGTIRLVTGSADTPEIRIPVTGAVLAAARD